MITEPLRNLLGDPASPLLGYWPTAAIGLVRSAGELWLQAPDDASKPDSTAMAEQISAWLFDGVGHHVPTPAPIQYLQQKDNHDKCSDSFSLDGP